MGFLPEFGWPLMQWLSARWNEIVRPEALHSTALSLGGSDNAALHDSGKTVEWNGPNLLVASRRCVGTV